MLRRTIILLAGLTVMAFLAPVAAAQSGVGIPVAKCQRECYPEDANGKELKRGRALVRTILYGHFEDILQHAPLNTQLPDPEPGKEPDLNRGFLMPTAVTHTGTDADVDFVNNQFLMFSSPGLVEIVDGAWRTHQEPGLAEDVEIASDTMNLYWYLSAHPVPNGNSQQAPGQYANLDVMPQVAIKARVETGRAPYSSKSTVIAEADTGSNDPALVAGDQRRVNLITAPGMPEVFEFQVPLEVKSRVLPGVATSQGFIVSVRPYQIEDDGSGTQFTQADFRLHTGRDFPPRLVFDQANPMETKASSLTLFNDKLFVRWSFLSPWGSYDADDASLSVGLTGPTQASPRLTNLVILKRSVDHDGHFKPINATWKFDFAAAKLADGDYNFHMSIQNLQRTYILEHDLPFQVLGGVPQVPRIGAVTVEGGGAQGLQPAHNKAPGFELALLLPAAALLAVLRRRQE